MITLSKLKDEELEKEIEDMVSQLVNNTGVERNTGYPEKCMVLTSAAMYRTQKSMGRWQKTLVVITGVFAVLTFLSIFI